MTRYFMQANIRRFTAIPECYRVAELNSFTSNKFFNVREKCFPTESRMRNKVVIEVHTSSINKIDVLCKNGVGRGILRVNHSINFPLVLGRDGFGKVIYVGDSVLNLKENDMVVFSRVYHYNTGTHSSHIIIDADSVSIAPKDLSKFDCAAFPYVSLTALQAYNCLKLSALSKVLVLGASGSVGSVLMQLLNFKGCSVYTLSSKEKENFCKSLGAFKTFGYNRENFFEELSKYKYDGIVDCSDFNSINENLYIPLMNKSGFYVTLNSNIFENSDKNGWILGSLKTLTAYAKKNIYFKYAFGINYVNAFAVSCKQDFENAVRMMDDEKTRFDVKIDSVYSLKDIDKAYERAESKNAFGKIIIDHENCNA